MDALKRIGIFRRPVSPGEVPPESRGGGRSRRRPRYGPTRLLSATGSLIVHGVLLAAFAAVVWRTTSAPSIGGREVSIDYDALALADRPAAASAVPASPMPLAPPPRAHEIAIQLEPDRTVASDERAAPVPLPSLVTLAAPAQRAPVPQSGDPGVPVFDAAPPNTGVAAAAGSDDPAENGVVVFAGLGASNARSVVYAVDASGSMVTSLPLVIAEVERSVSRLAATQKFGVVLFRRPPGSGVGGVEVFAPLLVRATPSARERLHDWLGAIEPAGRSVPLTGLERAMAYKPDAVFLLSRAIERSGGSVWDLGGRGGGGLAATLARIDTLNPRTGAGRAVVIQTIQFLDDDPTGTMQEIGRLHGSRVDAAGRTIAGYRVIQRGEDLGSTR